MLISLSVPEGLVERPRQAWITTVMTGSGLYSVSDHAVEGNLLCGSLP